MTFPGFDINDFRWIGPNVDAEDIPFQEVMVEAFLWKRVDIGEAVLKASFDLGGVFL